MKALRRKRRSIVGMLLLLMVFVGCQRSPQARRDRFIASGKKLMVQKDYARATIQFRNAVLAMPKDGEAYYQLGLAYLAAGDVRRGYGALKKAVEVNPSHAQAQLKIAQLQSATGDPEMMKDAAKQLESMLSRSGSDAETLNTLAFTEIQLGNLPAAAHHLEELLATSPRQLVSSVLLANAKVAQSDFKGAEEVLKAAVANDPKSADAVVILGRFYVSLNRPEAEQQFQKALVLDPRNAAALSSLGLVQYSGGRRQEAEQSFKRLAGFSDSHSNYFYGLFLFQENRPDEAVREFERLAKNEADDRDVRTLLIAAYTRVGRTKDAEAVLAKALQKNPNDTNALLERGEIYLTGKQYSLAEEDFNKVRKMRPDAPEIHYLLAKLNQERGSSLIYRQELNETLKANPGLLEVRLELARNLLQSKAAKSALEILDEAPERQKKMETVQVTRNWAMWALGDMAEMRKGIDAGMAQQRSSELLVQDGLWKLRAGNTAGAKVALEEALKLNPSDLIGLQALNRAYANEKDSSVALEKVREFAAQTPKAAPVQVFLGFLELSKGDRGGARHAFLAGKAAAPDYLEADLGLIGIDYLEHNYDQGRTKLEKLLTADPSNATANMWLSTFAEKLGNHPSAIEHLRKVVAVDPDRPQALNNLAYFLAEYSNNLDEALKYAQRAVELAPSDQAYADTLGWILYRKGIYPSAVRYLEQASRNPRVAIFKYHLAMAYAKAGNAVLSRTTLKAARKLDPNLPEAKEAGALVR